MSNLLQAAKSGGEAFPAGCARRISNCAAVASWIKFPCLNCDRYDGASAGYQQLFEHLKIGTSRANQSAQKLQTRLTRKIVSTFVQVSHLS